MLIHMALILIYGNVDDGFSKILSLIVIGILTGFVWSNADL